jgi:hypothetical protein
MLRSHEISPGAAASQLGGIQDGPACLSLLLCASLRPYEQCSRTGHGDSNHDHAEHLQRWGHHPDRQCHDRVPAECFRRVLGESTG